MYPYRSVAKRGFTRRAFLRMLLAGSALAVYPKQAVRAKARKRAIDTEVIVIGAGIAGLTAAAYLKNDDYDVVLFERENRVGGRTVSGEYHSFHYAKGTEYLGDPEDTLRELIDELDLQTVEIPAPTDAVFTGDQIRPGYDIIKWFIQESSIAETNRFIATILKTIEDYEEIPFFDLDSALADLDTITAQQWFERNNFPPVLRNYYNVAARGLFGANLDEISALSYLPEIAFDYVGFEPISSLDDLEADPGESTETYSFVHGITEVTQAIAQHLGSALHLNCGVTHIAKDDDIFIVRYLDENGTQRTMTAYAVVVAVPAPIALAIAGNVLSDEQKNIMEQIPYSAFATAALFSEQAIFDQAFDLSVPNEYFFTDIYDATWVQRHYDPAVRDASHSVMSVYIAPQSYHDRSLLALSDEEMMAKVFQDLDRIFPGASTQITGYDVHRFPFAYPVFTPGAYRRLTRLHEISGNGLYLAGDFMIYPTFEAAADSGYLAVEKVNELD